MFLKFLEKSKRFLFSTEIKELMIKTAVAFLLFFVGFWIDVFTIFSFCWLVVCMFFERSAKSMFYIFSFLPFQKIFYYNFFNYPTLWQFFLVAFVVIVGTKHMYCLFVRKEELNLWLAVSAGVLVLYIFALNLTSIGNATMVSCYILFTYICVVYRKEINFKHLVLAFSTMLLLSCFLGLIVNQTRFGYYLDSYPMNNVYRNGGLLSHPNILHIFVLIALCLLLFLFLKKQIFWSYFVLFAGLSFFGYSTVSQLFIFLFTLTLIFGSVMGFVFLQKKYGFLNFGYLSLLTLMIIFCMFSHTQNYALRFKLIDSLDVERVQPEENYYDTIDTSRDDPGRPGIWERNFYDWLDSPQSIIFGKGFDAEKIGNMSEHNTFLEILRKTGIVGFLMFLSFGASAVYEIVKNKKQKWFEILILIFYFGVLGIYWFMEPTIFSIRFMMFMSTLVLLLQWNTTQTEPCKYFGKLIFKFRNKA